MRLRDETELARFRQPGNCERCGRYCPDGRDPHHAFITKGAGGPDAAENLAALCRLCHAEAHADADVMKWVQLLVCKREGRGFAEIIEWLWSVVAAPKRGPCPPRPWQAVETGGRGDVRPGDAAGHRPPRPPPRETPF